MHVGVGGLVVVGHGVDHGLGLLGRVAGVQIDQRFAVDLLLEDREVVLDVGGDAAHEPTPNRT